MRHECIIQHAFKHNYILDIFHPTVSSLVAENARIQTIIVGKYGWDKNDANGYEKRNLLDLLLEMRQKRYHTDLFTVDANHCDIRAKNILKLIHKVK